MAVSYPKQSIARARGMSIRPLSRRIRLLCTKPIHLVAIRWRHGLALDDDGANALEGMNVFERITFDGDNITFLANGDRTEVIKAEKIGGSFGAKVKGLLRSGSEAHVGHDFVTHSSLPRLVALVRTSSDLQARRERDFEPLQFPLPDQVSLANRVIGHVHLGAVLNDVVRDVKRRREVAAMLFHVTRCVLVEASTVLDGVDAGAERSPDRGQIFVMRGDLDVAGMSLFDDYF